MRIGGWEEAKPILGSALHVCCRTSTQPLADGGLTTALCFPAQMTFNFQSDFLSLGSTSDTSSKFKNVLSRRAAFFLITSSFMKLSRRKGDCHRTVSTLTQPPIICHLFQLRDGFKDSHSNNPFGSFKVTLRMLPWLLTEVQASAGHRPRTVLAGSWTSALGEAKWATAMATVAGTQASSETPAHRGTMLAQNNLY